MKLTRDALSAANGFAGVAPQAHPFDGPTRVLGHLDRRFEVLEPFEICSIRVSNERNCPNDVVVDVESNYEAPRSVVCFAGDSRLTLEGTVTERIQPWQPRRERAARNTRSIVRVGRSARHSNGGGPQLCRLPSHR